MNKDKKEMLLFSIGNALKIIPNDKCLQRLFFEINNITFQNQIDSIGNYELGRLKRFVYLHVIDWDYEETKSKSDSSINNEEIVINFINSIPKYLLDYKIFFYKNTPYGKKDESNKLALLTTEIVDTQIKLFYTNNKTK